ncbi:MAG TPA: thiamine phosphate synthase [Candidatus Krumholzibacterium sp.]|nr:thiamine phosphate synthase [Candidatus Krumholzibacterium sp.]
MKENVKDHAAVVARIIDANTNRCAEGLRVVEEVARFVLEDDRLFREFKDLRHGVRHLSATVVPDPGTRRDSEADPGAAYSSGREMTRSSFTGICRANLMRAEEGLRVLEEFSKLVDIDSAPEFKRLRFRLYTLEKRLLGEAAAISRLPGAPFLYTFIDRTYLGSERTGEVARALVEGGSGIIQYRAKGIARSEMLSDLVRILPVTAEAGVPLVVNDEVDVARQSGADGVHLGSSDCDPEAAREILGENRIIGLTVHSLEEALSPACRFADYLGVGAVYPTRTKADVASVGTKLVSEIADATSLPVVAIGGIEAGNIMDVFDAGAKGAAVISAVLEGDVRKNCFTLKEIIDRRR